MEKKEKSKSKAKGKMAALKKMHRMASDMMGAGLKKVTVMAKDKKGLKKGLEKAEDIISGDEC